MKVNHRDCAYIRHAVSPVVTYSGVVHLSHAMNPYRELIMFIPYPQLSDVPFLSQEPVQDTTWCLLILSP